MPSYPDKSLHFGMQNFFYMDKDEGGSYYYYGFQDRHGAVLIMRTDTNTENALYYIEVGDFLTIWNLRSTYTYRTPLDLDDPMVEC